MDEIDFPATPTGGRKRKREECLEGDVRIENSRSHEDKAARSRERNREHARRTRMRKKAQLQALQGKASELEQEAILLEQALLECQIAQVLALMGRGAGGCESAVLNMTAWKPRQLSPVSSTEDDGEGTGPARFITSPDSTDCSDDENVVLAPHSGSSPRICATPPGEGTPSLKSQSHVNWKEGFLVESDGTKRSLTREELDALRRERNRMHAKMTRDRKKVLVANMEESICRLERDNSLRREILSRTLAAHVPSSLIPAVAGRLGIQVAVEE